MNMFRGLLYDILSGMVNAGSGYTIPWVDLVRLKKGGRAKSRRSTFVGYGVCVSLSHCALRYRFAGVKVLGAWFGSL